MSTYITRKTPGDTAWFVHDRFGMFIHFGLYSLPARHEWIRYNEEIPTEDYQKYFDHFDPDLYDPKEWARQAKAAGMRYAVFTTKHHEGFCLWDTKYTDYKVTNTKAGRDLVREYVDAFRAEGIHVGLYYSLIDWHHPDFTIDTIHPLRNKSKEFTEGYNSHCDMTRYAEYMRNQVEELLTNYGKIDILWFDFSYTELEPPHEWLRGKGKDEWEAEKLIALARKLQPGIIIDNRTQIDQDIWTPEQYQPETWIKHEETGELVTWEACQTFSGSWGYFRDEMSWKSPEMLIKMLIKTVACGGNLIMNVGPTARGYLDYRAEAALKVYADWMKYNSRSIYGCTMADPEFKTPNGCRLTESDDGKKLYIHLFDYPFQNLAVEGLKDKIEYIQFLHDSSELKFEYKDDITNITLPVIKPNTVIPVIEIFLK